MSEGVIIAPGFPDFWQAYPRKTAKQAAIKAWNRIAPGEMLRMAMHEALERQKQSQQWQAENGRYIPYPATWLNGRRWEDLEPDASTADADRFRCFVESKPSDLFATGADVVNDHAHQGEPDDQQK